MQVGHGGHRYAYVRFLIERDPSVVLLIDSQGLASDEYRVHLAEVIDAAGVEVAILPSDGSRASLLARAATIAREAGCHRLVFPDGDLWLAALATAPAGIRRGLACTFLVMRTPFGPQRRALHAARLMTKALLAHTIAHRWPDSHGYFLTDSTGVINRRPFLRSLEPLPDPQALTTGIERDRARATLGLPVTDFVIGLLGGVDSRKHPEILLEALRGLPPDVRVLLCGRVHATILAHIAALPESLQNRVTVRNGTLSDDDLAAAVRACDAVALLHDLDGPSGIMANALGLGVPVIAGESPWLRTIVTTLHCGVTAHHDVASVTAAITRLRRSTTSVKRVVQGTPQAFAEKLLSRC
ncbi:MULTISPECIES: glycosyltransferase [unclassified Blastococcus]